MTESGKIEELTKEKELDMLNQAYENHSNFMATSTEIWSEMCIRDRVRTDECFEQKLYIEQRCGDTKAWTWNMVY